MNHFLTFGDTIRKASVSPSFSTSVILMSRPMTLRVGAASFTSSWDKKYYQHNSCECKTSLTQHCIYGCLPGVESHHMILERLSERTLSSKLTIIVRLVS